MYQPKVSNTEKYSDSQGSHIVCPAKLILLDCEEKENNLFYTNEGEYFMNPHPYPTGLAHPKKPILISETEEIITGNKVYNKKLGKIVQSHEDDRTAIENNYRKILAFPEHFSDKHLQAIVDGKMKDGDEVLVKLKPEYAYMPHFKDLVGGKVYLDQQNHITLFPDKQSLDEAAHEYAKERRRLGGEVQVQCVNGFKAGAEWAKKNKH